MKNTDGQFKKKTLTSNNEQYPFLFYRQEPFADF